MKPSDKINVSDLVMVAFPVGEKTNNPAHELDGQQLVVKSKRMAGGISKGGDKYIYELHGAVSDVGVPYSFLTDELIRI